MFLCFCVLAEDEKHETIYVEGIYGNTIAADDDSKRPNSLSSASVNHELASGYQAFLGYRWKYFGLEAVYGDFGDPEIAYENKFKIKKAVHFAGGGLHWFFWILDIKLGWATFRGTRQYTIDDNTTSSISISPMNSKITSSGNYFGVGFNFNLGSNTELVLNYTGYIFKEKKVTYVIDGEVETFPKSNSTDSTDDNLSGFVGIVGIGIRWFL